MPSRQTCRHCSSSSYSPKYSATIERGRLGGACPFHRLDENRIDRAIASGPFVKRDQGQRPIAPGQRATQPISPINQSCVCVWVGGWVGGWRGGRERGRCNDRCCRNFVFLVLIVCWEIEREARGRGGRGGSQ